MNNSVDAGIAHVGAVEGFNDGTHVFEIDFNETVGTVETGFSIFTDSWRSFGVNADDFPGSREVGDD